MAQSTPALLLQVYCKSLTLQGEKAWTSKILAVCLKHEPTLLFTVQIKSNAYQRAQVIQVTQAILFDPGIRKHTQLPIIGPH